MPRIAPHALKCTEGVDIEKVVQGFLIDQGFDLQALGDCRRVETFEPGAIDACDAAPGERWHLPSGRHDQRGQRLCLPML
jgi:hypothetical protein